MHRRSCADYDLSGYRTLSLGTLNNYDIDQYSELIKQLRKNACIYPGKIVVKGRMSR